MKKPTQIKHATLLLLVLFFSSCISQNKPKTIRAMANYLETKSTSTSSGLVVSPATSSNSPTIPMISGLPQFYSPSIIFENGVYKMWATSGDRVRYFTSNDGVSWSGGSTVLSAQKNTWEIDGGNFEGFLGGISDPRVMVNAVSGWKYSMYYTAGIAPNTASSGGLGVAFSNDGVNWIRSSHNPLRRFPGGNAFAVLTLEIRGKNYFYFYGGGNAAAGVAPELRVAEILSNGDLGSDRVLSMGSRSYPLAYDAVSDKCLMAENRYNATVPEDLLIYFGSDCFSNMGSLIAQVGRNETTNLYNFSGAIKERSPNGHFIRTGKIQTVFSSGNEWGNWQPANITFQWSAEPEDVAVVPPVAPVVPVTPVTGFSRVESNNTLSGWPATRLIDQSSATAYSSNRYNSEKNTSSSFVAAWFSSRQSVNHVVLNARMEVVPQGFPAQYQIFLTSPDNSAWMDVGVYSTQPNASGKVDITLPKTYATYGLKIVPVLFGKDSLGSYYFQLAEMDMTMGSSALAPVETPVVAAAIFSRVESNNTLSGWPAERLIDQSSATVFSSNRFDSEKNTSGAFVAAWFSSRQTIKRVVLTARMDGSAQGFPVQYKIFLTSPDNSAWIEVGVYNMQPDASGRVEISLPQNYATYGLMVVPTTLGKDNFGSNYFQLAEIALAP